MRASFSLISALLVACFSREALAQAWVNSPHAEGIGVRVGDLELHPSLGGEFGYDSNYYRAAPSEGVVDVLRLRVTPSLTLNTLGGARRAGAPPTTVAFAASAHAAYNEIIPLESAESDASRRRDVGAGVNAKLDLFPRGKIGFDMLGAYLRVIEPDGSTVNLGGEGFNRSTLHAGAGATWRPGGGMFDWRWGYGITYNYFHDRTYDPLTNLQHAIGTRGRWRFLPRSSLLFDSEYKIVRYTDARAVQTDGEAVEARVGFHGLVTYHLSLLGLVGWASSFYDARPGGVAASQYDSLSAKAEARWFIQKRPNLDDATVVSGISSIALGYTRSFDNSYLGSFQQRDRGYLNFSTFLVGAVVGGLDFGVSRVAFPRSDVGAVREPAFDQWRVDGRAFAEYRFTSTLAANATFEYDRVRTATLVRGQDLDYDRWLALVGVRWFL
jgi:hypothetical protein